jgi:hypothetical protein
VHSEVPLRTLEIPVDYRKRIGGVSKVSGDFKASFRAGARILEVLFRVGAFAVQTII